MIMLSQWAKVLAGGGVRSEASLLALSDGINSLLTRYAPMINNTAAMLNGHPMCCC